MKKIVLILVVALFINQINAQLIPDIEWEETYGTTKSERLIDVVLTNDGGYLCVGDREMTSYSNKDGYLIKINSSGDTLWTKNYGGSDYDVFVSGIQLSNGDYVIVGSTKTFVTGSSGFFNNDVWLLKINSNGDTLWTKHYGGTVNDYATEIHETTDGGFIISGFSKSSDGDIISNNGNYDYLIIKTNSDGNLVWTKSYGGSYEDKAQSILQTSDGGYIVAGYAKSTDFDVTSNHGSEDYWVIKLDASGNLVWEKTFGGTSSDYLHTIIETNDNNFILAGGTGSSNGDINNYPGNKSKWVVKINPTGDILWEKCIEGIKNGGFILYMHTISIEQTLDDGYVLLGDNNYFDITKLNETGDIEWDNSFGGSAIDVTSFVHQLSSNEYLLAGYTSSTNGDVSFNNGSDDYWVVKLGLIVPSIIDNTPDTVICENDSIILNITPDGSSPFNFEWYLNDVLLVNSDNDSLIINTIQASDTGMYKCKVYTSLGSDSVNIHLGLNLLPDVSFTVTTPVLTEENSLITYTGETSSNDSLIWNFDGALTNPTGIGPHNISWDNFGTKSIQLILINENACTSQFIDTVIVNPTSTFETTQELCAGIYDTITYTGSAALSSTYTWDFDGSSIISGSGQGPYIVEWNTAGVKNISLFVEDSIYNSTTINTLTVNALPVATFTTNSPVLSNEDCIITYTGTTSSNDSLNWNIEDITPNPIGVGPHTVNWSDYGSKAINLIVIDDNACVSIPFSDTVIVNPTSTFFNSSSICQGINDTITYTGNALATSIFTWDFDGATIVSGVNQGPYVVKWNTSGTKNITLQVNDSIYESSFNNNIIVNGLPEILLQSEYYQCPGATINLSANVNGVSPFLYQWSQGGVDNNIDISVTDTTSFSLIVTDNNNCIDTASTQVNIFQTYQNQQICIVTVDQLTGKNKIIWEKTNDQGIESYLIKKEIGTNFYNTIAVIDANDTSIYIDYASSPDLHSDIYKISIIDTCGNESEIDSSYYHKTMNLGLSNIGSTMYLDWEQYEIEDEAYFPNTYYIYRGTQLDNMQLLDSVSGSVHSFNDLLVSQVYYYSIAIRSDRCDTAFSNIKDNSDVVTSINNLNNSNQIKIYPNPAHNQLTVSNEQLIIESIEITDITGKIILIPSLRGGTTKQSVNVNTSNLENGVYLIKIKTTDASFVKRFVKE